MNKRDMNQNEIILGCMHLGGSWDEKSYSSAEKQAAFQTIDAAGDNGITHFDHADIYTFGKSEKIFGEWLKANSAMRPKIKIQSKAGIALGKGFADSNFYRSDKKYLISQCENSLRNLQTDYLDTFLIHRPDAFTPPEEVAEAFQILKSSGKVKQFGVSNMSSVQMAAIQDVWDEPLLGNQMQFSLGHPYLLQTAFFENTEEKLPTSIDRGLLDYLRRNDSRLQAYSPLDRGKYLQAVQSSDNESIRNTKQLVAELSKKYRCSKEALVLAWIFKLPQKTSVVIGTGKKERIAACAEATKINLTHEDSYNLLIAAGGRNLP